MIADDVKAFLEHNGLADTIEMLHDTAPSSFGPDDAEALAKMTLILRVLSLPAESTSTLLKLIEELGT